MPIKPEFIEAEYQSFVEYSLIDEFSKGQRFEVVYHAGADEKRVGYDIEVKTLIPMFFQLKVSDYYPFHGRSKITLDRRNIFHFKDNPGHFSFDLHKDNKTGRYIQHNTLYELMNNGMYARYVAPLFYTRKTISHLKYNRDDSIKWGMCFHEIADIEMIHRMPYYKIGLMDWRDYIQFSHSVTISPHKIVDDTQVHHYSYNYKGELSFHSDPEKIEQNDLTLYEYLNYAIRNSLRSETQISLNDVIVSISRSIRAVNELSKSDFYANYSTEVNAESIEKMDIETKVKELSKLAVYLKDKMGILTIIGSYEL